MLNSFGRCSSGSKPVRRACTSSVASQVGRKRGGAGVSGSGSGPSATSSSSSPSRAALEAGEPRPQSDVHRRRVLRLDAGDPLERRRQRQLAALEQQLAREQRAVELAPGQRSHAPQARQWLAVNSTSTGTISSRPRYISAVSATVERSLNGSNEPIGPAKPSPGPTPPSSEAAAASAWNAVTSIPRSAESSSTTNAPAAQTPR